MSRSTALTRCTIAAAAALMIVAASAGTSFAQSPSMEDLTKAGQVSVGFNGNYNFTWTENETDAEPGVKVSNTTVFLMLSPEVSYFFADRLQVGLGVGLVMRPIERQTGEKPLSTDIFATVGPKYHVPVTDVLTFVPGIAVGAYFGGAPYDLNFEDRVINARSSTFGGIVNGQLAFNYLIGQRTSLVAGVMANFLFGSENLSLDAEQNTSVSRGVMTFNTTINLGVSYFF